MAVVVEEITQAEWDALGDAGGIDALVERLETLAQELPAGERMQAREAAAQTIEWAIVQGHLPAQVRSHRVTRELVCEGLLARAERRLFPRRPLQEIERRMHWQGLPAGARDRALPAQVPPDGPSLSLPPAVRPDALRPLDTVWKVDGRHLRLGEMSGAQVRRKAERALRLAIGNERTYRLFDGLAQQVGETQRVEEVVDDDRVYALAVEVLGRRAALSVLGRRTDERVIDEPHSEQDREVN